METPTIEKTPTDEFVIRQEKDYLVLDAGNVYTSERIEFATLFDSKYEAENFIDKTFKA